MKILCLGDSNTYGYDPASFLEDRYPMAWPEYLAELTGNQVINLGMNGREIPHESLHQNLIDAQITRHLPADLLIILLGTNDMLNARNNSASLVKQRLEHFLAHLTATFPTLPILLLTPMGYDMEGSWPALLPYPDTIPSIYAEMGLKYRIPTADCTQWNLSLTFDGVHLTEEGHRQFAVQLSNLLANLVPGTRV